MTLTKIVTLALSFALIAPSAGAATAKNKRKPSALAAPPQFVILAFDGSLDNSFWEESLRFADTVPTRNAAGEKTTLKFTYFVNPVYYIEDTKSARSAYKTPRMDGRSVSCIGWSKSRADIVPRIDWTAKAHRTKHEIGSHANSHCDASGRDPDNPMAGKPWGLENWRDEFRQFNNLLFNALSINGLKPSGNNPGGLGFDKSTIIGFRAPLLATTPSMWQALKEYGFKYDTSKDAEPNYWPRRHETTGIWNFPLARIKSQGYTRNTFSMDYNWLCRQSGCASVKNLSDTQRTRFKNEMLNSYKYYFKKSYHGNRAQIGRAHV